MGTDGGVTSNGIDQLARPPSAARRAKRTAGALLCIGALLCLTLTCQVARSGPAAAASGPATVGVVGAVVAPGGRFVARAPQRIVDTRLGVGAARGPWPVGSRFEFVAVDVAGVPTTATAVALNVTLVDSLAGGYVTLSPADGPSPVVSNLNVDGPGATRANFAIVALPADQQGHLAVQMAAGGELVVDVAGYWEPAATSRAGRFVARDPSRRIDTRVSTGPVSSRLDVAVAGIAVPADAAAVAVNVTATDAQGWTYVTVWPSGMERPLASTLNVTGAGTVSNLAIVPIGPDGQISLYSPVGVQLIVDVVGSFTSAAAAEDSTGLFVPLAPDRVADSREQSGVHRVGRGFVEELALAGAHGVPASGVSAVAVNVTATASTEAGYLLAYPARRERPWASTVNFDAGQDSATFGLTPLGGNGAVALFAARSTDVVVDLAGYFTGSAAPITDPVAPRRCSDLMASLHHISDPDFGQLWVRDLSEANPVLVVDGNELWAAVRVGPDCDYLLGLAKGASADRYDVWIITDVLTPMRTARRLVENLPWHGLITSVDGRTVYFYAGTDDRFGDVVAAYDLRSDRITFAAATPARSLGLLGFADHGTLALSLWDRTGQYGTLAVCSLGVAEGDHWCLPWTMAQPSAESVVRSVAIDGNGQVAVGTNRDGVHVVSQVLDVRLDPNGFQPRFTWWGEPVLSNAADRVGVWRYQAVRIASDAAAAPTRLLDLWSDESPAFASRWQPDATILRGGLLRAATATDGASAVPWQAQQHPSGGPRGELLDGQLGGGYVERSFEW